VGLTPFKPDFKLVANGRDITTSIRERLLSLSLTDATGFEADTLELVLADNEPKRPVNKPPRGAELQLFMGFSGSLVKMGVFVVDEIEISGWPGEMTIRARGAPFEKSKGGASHLQTQKTRSWPRETTIKSMVSKIAKEHGLEALVSKSLEDIELPHYDQTAESDVSFLVRVGKRYDAMVKPGGGKLAFLKRGEQKKADGSPMSTVTVSAGEALNFRFAEASRDSGGTVVAFWHSKPQGKRHQVEVGSGEPVKQLRQFYTTEEAAKDAAQAELDKRKRAQATFTVNVPGNPSLSAECTLKPSGFHPDIPTTWLVTRVVHRLGSDGYRCDVDAELPNDAGE
jgi:phage protein D